MNVLAVVNVLLVKILSLLIKFKIIIKNVIIAQIFVMNAFHNIELNKFYYNVLNVLS